MEKEYYYIIAIIAGLGVTIQAGVNSQLQQIIKNPLVSALISFLMGTIILLAAIAITNVKGFGSMANLGNVKWYQLTGGILGAFYIFSVIIVVPKIGAANMIGFAVAAQLIFSLIFDHFGWLGFPVREINWSRVFGALLLMAGLYFIKK